jgi:hypothetical protein
MIISESTPAPRFTSQVPIKLDSWKVSGRDRQRHSPSFVDVGTGVVTALQAVGKKTITNTTMVLFMLSISSPLNLCVIIHFPSFWTVCPLIAHNFR